MFEIIFIDSLQYFFALADDLANSKHKSCDSRSSAKGLQWLFWRIYGGCLTLD